MVKYSDSRTFVSRINKLKKKKRKTKIKLILGLFIISLVLFGFLKY